jgi:alpha/beta hydrolase fold
MQYRLVVLPLGTERGLVPLKACAVPPVPCWARLRERQTLMHTRHKAVIALDCRGHGQSDKPHDPKSYGIEMSQDVVRLLDHLGIPYSQNI